MSKMKEFHIVSQTSDNYLSYQTTRAAIADAVRMAEVEDQVKLYRVSEDEEVLLFDSNKCKDRTIDGILKWAEKGGRT